MTTQLCSSLNHDELLSFVSNQITCFFPDHNVVKSSDLSPFYDGTIKRIAYCFRHINNKYYYADDICIFDHLNSDHYAMWLYFLSNEIYINNGPLHLSKKLYLLNKTLHSCDIFYEVKLPKVFLLVHPVGTVLGRATYSDFLTVYQRVSIGSNHSHFPFLGSNLTLHPGSSILGGCKVADHCSIGAESFLLDRNLPPHSLYLGQPRSFLIKQNFSTSHLWKV